MAGKLTPIQASSFWTSWAARRLPFKCILLKISLDRLSPRTVLPVTAPSEVKLAHSVQQHSGLASLSPPTVVDPMMLQKGIILSLEGAGEAWKAAVRVRLLHGVVRQRISRSRRRMQEARDEPEEQEDEVLPLNQEDMVGTLASFAVAPLWCLERMKVLRPMNYQGHVPNERDRLAYLRTWRYGALSSSGFSLDAYKLWASKPSGISAFI